MNKKQIEAIYPLTFTQNGLLLHHLEEAEDQGLIQVNFELKGELDVDIFQKSWESVINRHEALRSSVHYKKIKTPVRIIHRAVEFSIFRHDLLGYSSEEQQKKVDEFKLQDRIKGLDLSKTPTFRVNLFQLSADSYYLLWTCHHIILDGWSGMNVCKDLLHYYNCFVENKPETTFELDPLPKYKTYLDWLKEQDAKACEVFWKNYFKGFETPSLFSRVKHNLPGKYESINFVTNVEDYKKVKTLLLQYKLTESSFIQGIWALLLNKYFKTDDVSYGTITSGRAAEIPNMESMADMYTNLVPARIRMNQNLSFVKFLEELQNRQLQTHDYNYAHLNEIISWTDLGHHQTLFDSLLIIENFPENKKQYTHLNIADYKSDITSSMPISLAVKSSNNFDFLLKYNSSLIPKEFAQNLVFGLKKLMIEILSGDDFDFTILSVLAQLDGQQYELLQKETKFKNREKKKSSKKKIYYSETETTVLRIWQYLFNKKDIELQDDFFELGGTSFLAIKLSSLIKEKLGFNFKPTALIKRRSIKSIAILIDNSDKEENETWRSLITLNESGDKTPLFCIHTEGGYTLIFKAFSNYFTNKRPVYGLQPKGLDGVSSLHTSIEELAEDYIKEMKTVQPNGPYYLLSYCWRPSAIANEIAVQLNAAGEIAHIIAVDSNFYISKRYKNYGKTLAVLKLDAVRIKLIVGEVNFILNQWKSRFQKKKIVEQKREDEQIRIIRRVDNNIAKFFRSYKPKPFKGSVLCIISSSFMKHFKYEINPRIWKKNAALGFKKIIIEGKHADLFMEPHVKTLAKISYDFMSKK